MSWIRRIRSQRLARKALTSDAYLIQLIAYIHRHPQKHGFVDDYREWEFSSITPCFHRKQRTFSGMRCWVGSMAWLDSGPPTAGRWISP